MAKDPTKPDDDEIVRQIHQYVYNQLEAGVPRRELERDLVEKGLSPESAEIVIRNIEDARQNHHKEAGKKNMLYGALWCGGGILVTAVTMGMAAGGGSYVVAWGAIAFGAIQFFRGMAQASG